MARLTLNTLINTYDSSEFLAKAKLAIADSWMRQSGPEGMAQAEAEFKDFQLFYPTMEEAPEAQSKICEIHIRQMEKADRDPNNALRAEQECRDLLTKYPNSKFAPQTEQRLREIQQTLAEAEMVAGIVLLQQGSARRCHEPLYRVGGPVSALQPRRRSPVDGWQRLHQNGCALPPKGRRSLRPHRARLSAEHLRRSRQEEIGQEMEMPVPEADPAAVARMKYEAANHVEPGRIHKLTDFMRRNPDVSDAAKSGAPTMDPPKREIPASVPQTADAVAPRVQRRRDGGAGKRTFRARYPARRASGPAGAGQARGCSRSTCHRQHQEIAIARYERDPAGG